MTVELWQKLLAMGIKPAGLGARDTLRLEMGYPLMGHEMSSNVTPLEAGFNGIVSQDKELLVKKA